MGSGPVTIAAPRLRQRSHSHSVSLSFHTASASSTSTSSEFSSIALHPLRKRRTSTVDRYYSPLQVHAGAEEPPAVAKAVYPPPPRKRRNINKRQKKKKMPFLEAHYHPFLFAMMTLSAMAELGLTAFLLSAGNENGTWPTRRYHSLLIMFSFNSAWTMLFSTTYMLWYVDGASHFLANVASSVIWLLVTSALWGTAAGIMHNTRTGGDCARRATISRCRQSLTVEALGWTEFGLCALTMIVTCLWILSSRYKRRMVGDSGSDLQRLV